MSADPDSTRADPPDPALPQLATVGISADPHLIAAFDVAAEQWFPAVAGFAVTVLVHTVDAETGRPRYLPPAEPADWARAIFSIAGATHGYFLGAVETNTGGHRDGQLAYRLYLDTDRQAIPVPRQVLNCPHYLLSAIDGREQITIPTTA